MRRLTLVASIAALTLCPAIAAAGGGAVWQFEGYHEPGDVVESTTAVAWGHDASLGLPEDGPYLIYLAPAGDEVATWPSVPEESLLVGIVEVYEGPYTLPNGDNHGPHHAVARFEVPDVPPGDYQLFHCNDPCTTTLGDIIGGWGLRVVGGDAGRSAEVVAAEVRDRLPNAPLVSPSPTPPAEAAVEPVVLTSIDRISFWVVGVVGALLVVHMLWTDPNRRFQTVDTTLDDQTEVLR